MSDPQQLGDVVNLDDLRTGTSDSWTTAPPAVERATPPSVPSRYAVQLDQLDQSDAVAAVKPVDGRLRAGPWAAARRTGRYRKVHLGRRGRTLAPSPVPLFVLAGRGADGRHESGDGHPHRRVHGPAEDRETPALVLDDLGTELPTGWQTNVLTELVAQRYDQSLTLVATTNLTPRQLEQRLGERTVSRLHEMCELVEVTGADRRRP